MNAQFRRAVSAGSLTFRLQLAKAISALEAACRAASDRSWDRVELTRAHEIASSLAETFRLEGFRDPAVQARSLACLMALTGEQIQPIEDAFREKVGEVLASLRETAEGILIRSAL